MMTGGSTLIKRDSAVPMRSLPETSSGSRVMLWALRTPSRISSAWGSSLCPAWVSLMCLPMRSNSWACSSSSSCLICIVTADWEYPSCLAALEKFCSSAMRTKVIMFRISMAPPIKIFECYDKNYEFYKSIICMVL